MKKIAQVIGSKRLTADVLTVAETVKNLNPRFSFDVIIPRDAEYRERFLGLGVRVITFDEIQNLSAKTVAKFKRYFGENPADLVHTHVSAGARIGARLAGIKTCISSRGFNSDENRDKKRLTSPLYNAFTTATLCTTESMFDSLVKEGVKRDRIFPLLPYRALGDFSKPANISEGEELIVCPLPFYRGFGQKTLIRAFSRLLEKRRSRLLFVGDGPEKEEFRLLVSRLGVGGRVEFCTSEMLTKVYNTTPRLTVFTQEESWELPCALLGGVNTPTVASNLSENKDLFPDSCEFYISGDAFSLERALICALSRDSSRVLSDSGFRAPIDLICDTHERVYTALLSL